MKRLALLALLAFTAEQAPTDAPFAVEVRRGGFEAADGGQWAVGPNPDGGTAGAYLNEPALMLAGRNAAGCGAFEATVDAGDPGPQPAFVITAAAAIVATAAIAYAAGKLSK